MLKVKKTRFSQREIKDLIKAWVLLSLAFAILLTGGIALDPPFVTAFLISALTVGTGFIFHELGHKFLAQKYGCHAEFKSFDGMLLFAVLLAFFGFILAAPGAVMISGPVGTRRNGKISAMGPLINVILALIFIALFFIFPSPAARQITFYGYFINALLASFNMIPFGLFDGKKVFLWNKPIYYSLLSISLVLFFLSSFLGQGYFPG